MAHLITFIIGVVLGFILGAVVGSIIPNIIKKFSNSPIETKGAHSWIKHYYCPQCKIPLLDVDDHRNNKYRYMDKCNTCGLKLDWSKHGIAWTKKVEKDDE